MKHTITLLLVLYSFSALAQPNNPGNNGNGNGWGKGGKNGNNGVPIDGGLLALGLTGLAIAYKRKNK